MSKIELPVALASSETAFATNLNLNWLVESRAEQWGEKRFFVFEPFAGESETWTYRRFADDVARVAAGLAARGVAAGHPVLIHLENCPQFLLAWFACARLGAVAVSTNTRSSAEEVAYYVAHCGTRIAITQTSLMTAVEAALPTGSQLLIIDEAGERSFGTLFGAAPVSAFSARGATPVSIQYTSGTTGRPKAVIWTHANALWGAKVNAAHIALTENDVLLVFPPLFHTNAQAYSVLPALYAGASFVLQPRFSSSRFWTVSLRHKCTFASQLYFTLRALAAVEKPASHYYRLWGTGICDHPVAKEHFGISTIGWWGMTETISHPIVGDVNWPNRAGTIGRAAPEYEVAVRDENGAPTEAGATGDLFVKGVPGISLFAGYLKDPDATREAYTEEGWFRTGDRITVADDGSMIFADRSKDMLRVGAENVAASEIERVILSVPGVREVAVVAKPDAMLDEVPVAFVIPVGADDTLTERVLAECNKMLADFKVPREVFIVPDLPRATLGKVAKQELRARLG